MYDSSHLGEYNFDNSDLLQHQSLSDIPDHHCSQKHEQDLCHPAARKEEMHKKRLRNVTTITMIK